MINKKSSTQQAVRMTTYANSQQEVINSKLDNSNFNQNQQVSLYTLNQFPVMGHFEWFIQPQIFKQMKKLLLKRCSKVNNILIFNQIFNCKRTDANNTDNIQQQNKNSFLKLYSDSSPKLCSIQSRVSSQAIVQDIKIKHKMPQQVIILLEDQLVRLLQSILMQQKMMNYIKQLFLSKTQAGQNGNKQIKTNQDQDIWHKNRYLFSVCDNHGVYGHYILQLIKKVLLIMIDQQLKTFIGIQEIAIGEDLNTQFNNQQQQYQFNLVIFRSRKVFLKQLLKNDQRFIILWN